MSLLGKTGLVVLVLCALLWTGCNQTFRPIANPVIGPGGDPGSLHGAVVLENNGGGTGGADTIDLSGDTVTGFVSTGTDSVHAAVSPGGGETFVANQGEDSVFSYTTFLTSIPGTLISLAPGSKPVFLNTTQNAVMFAAEAGTGKVARVTSSSVAAEISVGGTPVALAETGDTTHLYCLLTNGTVEDLSPSDFTAPLPPPIAVGANPAFAVASSDSTLVFVVNQGAGTVSVIQTSTDTVVQTLTVGASPNFAFYDSHLKRVYVTNSGGNTVSVINASGSLPFPAPVNVTVGNAPVSVTALADGTRAYVANSADGTVSVINAPSLTVSKTIPVGTKPISIASSKDSTRVVVANRDTVNPGSAIVGSISDISTTTDTVIVTFVPTRSNPILVLAAP